jgi:hypothetical protein
VNVREKETAPAIQRCNARDDGTNGSSFPNGHRGGGGRGAVERAERRSEREARICAVRRDLIAAG